ncbi:Transposon Tf2-1 polyprotein, putative, partial [Rhizoctonia solani AG-3 Rhs1AP]
MEFRNIKEELDWDEKPLIDTFIAGLKDNIKAEIMRIKITNDQVDNYSLEKIIELAIRTGDMLRAEDKVFTITFYAMPLGDTQIILGLPWLQEANPIICWRDFSLTFREENPIKGKLAGTLQLPDEISDFQDVFSEELFKQLPEHRPYDCAINFKPEAELPKPGKVYPMSPAESRAMKEYLEKELTMERYNQANHNMLHLASL